MNEMRIHKLIVSLTVLLTATLFNTAAYATEKAVSGRVIEIKNYPDTMPPATLVKFIGFDGSIIMIMQPPTSASNMAAFRAKCHPQGYFYVLLSGSESNYKAEDVTCISWKDPRSPSPNYTDPRYWKDYSKGSTNTPGEKTYQPPTHK